jgi:hypothetical protein
MNGGKTARPFRRSLMMRLTSLGALLLFASAMALRAAEGDYGAKFLIVTAVALAALAGTISAWGDRFLLDDEGVTWENRVLVALAAGRSGLGRRRLAWRDVARIQAHGGHVFFLVPYRGRRMALDAIEDFEEFRRRVEMGVAAARAPETPGVSIPPADRPR